MIKWLNEKVIFNNKEVKRWDSIAQHILLFWILFMAVSIIVQITLGSIELTKRLCLLLM